MLEVLNKFVTRRDARKKRSLLPFVADVLSTLFGAATQKDLDQLRDGLIAFDNSQSQLAHVLAHSMTVINKTNSEVRNRAVVNQLSQGLSRLDQGFSTWGTRTPGGTWDLFRGYENIIAEFASFCWKR